MNISASAVGRVQAGPVAPVATRAVPFSLYAVLFASTSVIVGVLWDISWHQTIGRDTFWTPAHLAIYLGGIVAGITCGWLALATTFAGAPEARAQSVRFWGFLAPLGAWVCIWGTFAMLTSAPFDDWWHNTYGLDVKILSPPHAVLASGIAAIQIGAMLMAVALQNRTTGADKRLVALYLVSAGLLLLNAAIIGSEYLERWTMHTSFFYQVACAVFPFVLVSTARASKARWPATFTALVYMGVTMVMIWTLQLFEGRALLGPIYVQVDRFIPTSFPLMLVVPGLAIDIVTRRLGRGRDWLLAATLAVAFLASFLPAQWLFADFYVSPWGRNWFFASHLMPYFVDPPDQQRWFILREPDNLLVGLPIALVLGFVSARCGLWWGNWMSRVRR
jgi:hypothetical protein